MFSDERKRAMTNQQSRSGIFYGVWITLLMLYVLFFNGGMGFYSYQVFVPRFEEAFGWTRFETVVPAAVWALVYGLSGFFIGAWIQRFGIRTVIVSATLAGTVLYLVLSMITQLWQLHVVLALLGVVVAATTLVPAQTVITLWFNKNRGRAMGFTLMGIGLGGMALPPLVAWLIQEVGWRGTYRVAALAILVLTLPPVLLFLKNKPSDIGEIPDGRAATGAGAEETHVPIGIPASRAVRTPTFWLLFFTYLLQLYVMSGINVNTTAFAEGVGYTPLVAPLFMAFAVGISVPGRFVFGWLTERIAPQVLMAAAGLLLASSAIALHLLVIEFGVIGYVPIWTFGFLQGLGIAASTVVLPILVGRCFGDLEFGKIQGLVMAGFAVGVIFGGPSAAKIFDVTGSYAWAFVLCALGGAVSTVLVLLVRPHALHGEFQTAEPEATSEV
jgi:MFS family permease